MTVPNSESKEVQIIKIEELFKKLNSSNKGLSTLEAKQRIEKYGRNEIVEKKVSPLFKFLKYFWGPIPWMIELALILSAILKHWPDFAVIMSLLIINAVIRFSEEFRADRAIEMLKKRLAKQSRVLRDTKWEIIDAAELVPGDVIRVRLGDIVPADIKLISGDYISTDESALTGESLPVDKRIEDIAYSGSIVRQGEMNGTVFATGMNTFFGKTTKLVESAKTTSHFQKAIMKIGNYLIITSIFLVIIMFIVELVRHAKILDTVQFALVLVIAAIPAALPAVLSITMAIGAAALAKKDAIVSKLLSIEEMAGADVLCSDKTGTITRNLLSVEIISPGVNYDNNDVIFSGMLASRKEDDDPIDNAIISKSKDFKDIIDSIKGFKIKEFIPFDPVRKRTEVTVSDATGREFKVSKGAPQVILSLIDADEKLKNEIIKEVDKFAENGYRALGIAQTKNDNKWDLIGLIGLSDAPREDSAPTIKEAQSMGLEVKMVTGDHIAIAKRIAGEVNLGTNIKTASGFIDKPDRLASKEVEEADGFAEVYPEHKYHIIELLQQKNHIVGMTGDGVNDAPALKKADVGIAVDSATDAAKSAADIIFTKPGLSVIVEAIKQSRRIFERMNSYAIYRIAETIRVLLFLVLSILVLKFYPLTTIMIVLLALLNDIPIMMIAYDNTKLSKTPVRWDMRNLLSISSFLGITGVIFSFTFLIIARDVFHLSDSMLQTAIFLKLLLAGHLTIYLTRTGNQSFWIKPFPSIKLFLASEATQLLATTFAALGIFMTPIGWKLVGFIWAYVLLTFIVTNFLKLLFFDIANHSGIIFKKISRSFLK